MSGELHPQVDAYLRELSAAGVPPLYRLDLEAARETYRDICVPDDPPEAVGGVEERTVPGPDGQIPIRVYTPSADAAADRGEASEADSLPVFVFYHGGGWMLGDLDTHDPLCRAVANAAGCLVAAVGYRRAPEHPFPAALEDCYAATRWIARNAGSLGGDAESLAVGGDSAGGTLAAGVAVLARDRGEPAIDRQVLAYPATNYAFDTASYEENASGYFLTRDDMRRFWSGYLRTEADGRHPLASPLRADRLAGVAPAVVLTCGFDPLRDEGRAFADRLADEGVPGRHVEYDDMIHGFLTMLSDPALDRAREGIEVIAAELHEGFGL